jgi:hypothetical protein
MKSLTKKEFGNIIKKMDSTKSYFASSRISGWGNSSEGIDYEYPRFDWSYVRDYKKIKSYSSEPFETMTVSYTAGTRRVAEGYSENYEKFVEEFTELMPEGTYTRKSDGTFEVNITNPFF